MYISAYIYNRIVNASVREGEGDIMKQKRWQEKHVNKQIISINIYKIAILAKFFSRLVFQSFRFHKFAAWIKQITVCLDESLEQRTS